MWVLLNLLCKSESVYVTSPFISIALRFPLFTALFFFFLNHIHLLHLARSADRPALSPFLPPSLIDRMAGVQRKFCLPHDSRRERQRRRQRRRRRRRPA